MANDFIEIARSPDVYATGPAKGAFRDENLVLFDDSLTDRQHNWSAIVDLPPGTYYVHVADLAPPTCPTLDAPTCIDEFSNVLTFTIAPPPPPPSPSRTTVTTPPARDTVTAFASLSVPKRQRVRQLTVRATMSEAGTIAASGIVDIPNAARLYRFKEVSATAAPGVIVKLRLKLPGKALKAARRALRHHRRVRATITIKAQDAAGNVAVQTRTVTLEN
jgi:hypothetical protein